MTTDSQSDPEPARKLIRRAVELRRDGAFDAAGAILEEVLALSRGSDHSALLGEALAERGILLKEQALLQDAREHYLRAIELLQRSGDLALEGRVFSDLGALHLEEGRADEAMECIHRGLEIQLRTGNGRYQAISRFDLAAAHLESVRPRLALESLALARARFAETGEPAGEALVTACEGAASAMLDDVVRAEERFVTAKALAQRAGHRGFDVAISVHRGHLDLALARRTTGQAGIAAAVEVLQRAQTEELRPGLPFMKVSDDIRFAVRVLSRALREAHAPDAALKVGPGAAWFEPPHGQRVELKTRHTLQRMFELLVRRRQESPGSPVTLAELQEAGWPLEAIRPTAAANRLHVALATLRNLGLRPLLLRKDNGYLLDPDLAIEPVHRP